MSQAEKINDGNEQKEESKDVSKNQVDESKGSVSSLVGRVKSFIKGAGEPSESSTGRDGAFSYSGEVHAFGLGAGVGVASSPKLTLLFIGGVLRGSKEKFSRDPHLKDAIDEPAYSLAGYFMGKSVNNAFTLGNIVPQLLGSLPV